MIKIPLKSLHPRSRFFTFLMVCYITMERFVFHNSLRQERTTPFELSVSSSYGFILSHRLFSFQSSYLQSIKLSIKICPLSYSFSKTVSCCAKHCEVIKSECRWSWFQSTHHDDGCEITPFNAEEVFFFLDVCYHSCLIWSFVTRIDLRGVDMCLTKNTD